VFGFGECDAIAGEYELIFSLAIYENSWFAKHSKSVFSIAVAIVIVV